jgi:small basic protein (TIGR04137 family)
MSHAIELWRLDRSASIFNPPDRPKLTIGFSGGGVLHSPPARNRKRVRKPDFLLMSQHRSLRAAALLGGKRNVLKRYERVEILKKRGQWKEGDRITGLRKTKPDV